MTITTLIRESIEPRAKAMYRENWQKLHGWLPPAWETTDEWTRNRWRIRAWLEVLDERKKQCQVAKYQTVRSGVANAKRPKPSPSSKSTEEHATVCKSGVHVAVLPPIVKDDKIQ